MKRKKAIASTSRILCRHREPWYSSAARNAERRSRFIRRERAKRASHLANMSNLTSIPGRAGLVTIEQPETLRAPEVEKGVGCDFDSYLLVPDHSLDERIAAAKAKLGEDVVILGHHYQRDEVVKFADFRGDSLKLSQQAAKADAKYIVF